MHLRRILLCGAAAPRIHYAGHLLRDQHKLGRLRRLRRLDRLPLAQFGTHNYANNGYTLTVTATGGVVSVTQSDCPGQDCVHSGAVSRAGQSIVCLPARIVVELVGAADGYDLVTG